MARALLSAVTALCAVSPISAQDPLWTPARGVPEDLLVWETAQRRDAPSITESRWVVLDAQSLRAIRLEQPDAAREFTLTLGDTSATVRIGRVAPSLGHRVFHGTIDGGSFLLALGDDTDAAAAEIFVGDEQYTLNSTFRDGYYVVRRHDWGPLANRPDFHCGNDESHVVHPPEQADLGGGRGSDQPAGSGGRTQVDVNVFFTPQARDAQGGIDAMRAEVVLRVANANVACERCSVDIEYRLTYQGVVDYAGGDSDDLRRFRGTNDGYMDDVHTERQKHGADIMCLIVQNAAGYCGVGYLMRPSSPNFGPNAFSITKRSCLSNQTMTHEMGHNQGCHHDRDNASSGAWPHSYGYRTPDNRYRSVMSYAPGTRVNYWSSPNVTYQGYVFGTSGDDNARGLNRSKDDIRQFYATVTLNWSSLGGGIAGDTGRPTLTGSGSTHPGVPIEMTVGNSVPGTPGVLIIGSHIDNTPLFGGTLIPNIAIILPLTGSATDIVNDISVLGSQPSGADFYFQAWFLDGTAPQGVSASDGLGVIVP